MQIMCLNGWGGRLADDLLAYLTNAQPDILCLQEVVHSPDTTQEWLTYRDDAHVLPQRPNFFSDVCQVLPDHIATFSPAARGVLWDGDAAVSSFWGLATFVHRRLPIIGQKQGFVHKGFEPDGYGDHPRSRSAHGVRVFDARNNRTLSVTHMHGLRDLAGKMDTPERKAQAHQLLKLSQDITEDRDLAVICGDFNVTETSETLTLLRNAGFTELVTQLGFPGTRTSYYDKPGRFADYLAINDVSAVQAFQVVDQPQVSDHCPLVLTI